MKKAIVGIGLSGVLLFTVLLSCSSPTSGGGSASIVFSEGFDGGIQSAIWTIEKPGVSSNTWTQGNYSASNFNVIDPSSVYSAIVSYDSSNTVDTWLKTNNSYPIVTGSYLEFYAGYSGSWLSGGSLTFFVSVDSGATWTQLWTTGSVDIPARPGGWSKITTDLSIYTGKSLKFAWQYYGQNGDIVGLDGIKLFKPDLRPQWPPFVQSSTVHGFSSKLVSVVTIAGLTVTF